MLSVLPNEAILGAPPTAYYVPNFISEDEEAYLVERVLNAPKPKWEYLARRRLQNYGGIIGKNGLIPCEDIPDWLRVQMRKIADFGIFPANNKPNHVLINEYSPGQGIMPHEDGPRFFPTVTTINLGSHTLLDFYHRANGEVNLDLCARYAGSLLLERRSLIVLRDDLYTDYLHGIAERIEDNVSDKVWNVAQCTNVKIDDVLTRGTRISLTIRNVPKVASFSVQSLLQRK